MPAVDHTPSTRHARAGALASVFLVIALAGCASGPAPASTAAAETPSPPSSASPTTLPPTGGLTDYTRLCEANAAASRAVRGTIGDSLAATQAQAAALQEVLPLTGVPADVAAGAGVFATSLTDAENILQQFPPDAIVADVGLDERFTQSEALKSAMDDRSYQAFIGWMIETCGTAIGGY